MLKNDNFAKMETIKSYSMALPTRGSDPSSNNKVPSNLCSSHFFSHLGDSDAGTTSTRESLNSHDLEVVRVAKAVLGPVGEVVASGDRAGSALGLANRPVLLEGGSTSDGGLVGAGVGADSVDTAITGDGTELGDTRLAGAAGVV